MDSCERDARAMAEKRAPAGAVRWKGCAQSKAEGEAYTTREVETDLWCTNQLNRQIDVPNAATPASAIINARNEKVFILETNTMNRGKAFAELILKADPKELHVLSLGNRITYYTYKSR